MITNTQLRILVRPARMLLHQEQRPNSENAGFEESMKDYRYFWSKLTQEQKTEVISAAQQIHDLTPEIIDAALAALER